MTLIAFKLPRKPLSKRPGKRPEPVQEVLPPDPLKDWHPGFSVKAAHAFYEEDLKLVAPSRPAFEVEMPEDITVISSRELGMLHAQYTAYVAWLEAELATLEITAREDAAFLEHTGALVRLSKAGTVADKGAKTLNDQRYVAAEQAALTSSAKAKFLKVRVSGYERLASALSREMTRRQITE
jgi:hypothetical protein